MADPPGSERLLLKWGTLKGWDHLGEASVAALKAYLALGEHSPSAMFQKDSPDQKQALCNLIDAVDGEIVSDWSGEVLTKEAAKKYVMDYRA